MSAQYICFSFTVNAAFFGTKEAWLNLEGRAARMYVVLIFLPFIYSRRVNWANLTFTSDALCHIHTLTRGSCSVQPELCAVSLVSAHTCETPCSKTT